MFIKKHLIFQTLITPCRKKAKACEKTFTKSVT